MSLAGSIFEARVLYTLLHDIEETLNRINKITGATSTQQAATNLREAEVNAYAAYLMMRRVLNSMQRLGLPEDMRASIGFIQDMNVLVNSLRLAMIGLEASTPFGWLKAAVMILSAGTQVYAMAEENYSEGVRREMERRGRS